jgi:hypothetical protein
MDLDAAAVNGTTITWYTWWIQRPTSRRYTSGWHNLLATTSATGCELVDRAQAPLKRAHENARYHRTTLRPTK